MSSLMPDHNRYRAHSRARSICPTPARQRDRSSQGTTRMPPHRGDGGEATKGKSMLWCSRRATRVPQSPRAHGISLPGITWPSGHRRPRSAGSTPPSHRSFVPRCRRISPSHVQRVSRRPRAVARHNRRRDQRPGTVAADLAAGASPHRYEVRPRPNLTTRRPPSWRGDGLASCIRVYDRPRTGGGRRHCRRRRNIHTRPSSSPVLVAVLVLVAVCILVASIATRVVILGIASSGSAQAGALHSESGYAP